MSRPITKKTMFAGLAAAGVLAVGIAAPTMAFAGDSAGSSSTTQTDRGQRRAERDAAFAKALAAELGVSEDKVAAALDKVREQLKPQGQPKDGQGSQQSQADRQAALKSRLDQAVKDGKLTQQEADAILKAYEAGVLSGGGRGPRGGSAPTGTPNGTPESTPESSAPTR